jgi:hypothetical protein
MNPILLSSLIHSLEALVVAGIAIAISHFFPEHRVEAGTIALFVFSNVFKTARVSEKSPIADYVNDITK